MHYFGCAIPRQQDCAVDWCQYPDDHVPSSDHRQNLFQTDLVDDGGRNETAVFEMVLLRGLHRHSGDMCFSSSYFSPYSRWSQVAKRCCQR